MENVIHINRYIFVLAQCITIRNPDAHIMDLHLLPSHLLKSLNSFFQLNQMDFATAFVSEPFILIIVTITFIHIVSLNSGLCSALYPSEQTSTAIQGGKKINENNIKMSLIRKGIKMSFKR